MNNSKAATGLALGNLSLVNKCSGSAGEVLSVWPIRPMEEEVVASMHPTYPNSHQRVISRSHRHNEPGDPGRKERRRKRKAQKLARRKNR